MRLKSKRLISLLLAGSMMVSMLPASAVTAFAETTATAVVAENSNTETSGDCGAPESNNVHWNYASGVLSITGTGAMANFKMPTDKNPKADAVARPWESLVNEITEVKISEGITSIGDNAFRGFTALTTANIPASISKLGDYIFRSDAALKNVTWAPGFTATTEIVDTDSNYQEYKGVYVPTSMFDGCTSLGEGVELSTWLPSSFKGIGCAAFRGTAFTIDFDSWSNLEYIGAYAFSEMPNLTHFTLTNKYKIGLRGQDTTTSKPSSRAFFESGLEEFNSAADVTDIPRGLISGGSRKGALRISAAGDLFLKGYGFSGNTTIQHVTVDVAGNYITDSSNRFNVGTFRNAKALETFVLKATSAKLDDRMFVECPKLRAVDLTQCGSITYDDMTGWGFSTMASEDYVCEPLNSSVIFCVKNESQNPRNYRTGLSATHGIVFVVGDGDVDVNKEGFDSVSKPGYATRWYTDSDCTNALTADEVKAGPQIGKTYYAAYKTLHTVTFADADVEPVKVANGEQLEKPTDPKKDGYKFDYWCAANGDKVTFPLTITDDTTLTAKWTSYNTKVDAGVKANADPASKTVEIAVNVEAAPAELNGATATLNFTDANDNDDSNNVAEVKVNGTPVNKDENDKYTVKLNKLMQKTSDASENGADAAMLADVDEGAVVPSTMMKGTALLTVTYKTPGKHRVEIVLNAANGDVICKKPAIVEIAPEPGTLNFTGCTAKLEDGTPVENGAKVPVGAEVTVTFDKDADSDLVLNGWKVTPETLTDTNDTLVKDITADTFTFVMPETDKGVTIEAMTKAKAAAPAEDDSMDAAAVVTGVVLGTGTAILAYHIGTEVYAEQVLGKGVAIPRTREEVALKAWELAGKPAVELNGEPLSEAAQAEKWAVESGLMQNVDGSFNGSKKMSKLKALRTLDAAKKLG